jgi:hypothetical protein
MHNKLHKLGGNVIKNTLTTKCITSNSGRRGCDHMVVAFTTTCAISTYYHLSTEFKSCSWRDVTQKTKCAITNENP